MEPSFVVKRREGRADGGRERGSQQGKLAGVAKGGSEVVDTRRQQQEQRRVDGTPECLPAACHGSREGWG